jgi:hypothetical protein
MLEPYVGQIESLSHELAAATLDGSAAIAALTEAEEYQTKIAGRVAELAAQREAITSRRAAGTKEADDGASLALILADLEGLSPLLQEAAQRVAAAQRVHAEHSARAGGLRQQIAQIEGLAARNALVKHADDLSAKLFDTVRALEDACRRTGHSGRPLWGAPQALYQALRGLAAARGEL